MSDQLAFPWTSRLSTRDILVQLPAMGPWTASDHEREFLDFKETPATTRTPKHIVKTANESLRTDIVETAISFANARGGTIVIGVRDRAEADQAVVPGVDLDEWTPDELRRIVYDRTAPHLLVHPSLETVHEQHVLVVGVDAGPEIYGTTQGVFKHRRADQNLPLDEPTMRALRAARGSYDWSAETVEAGPEAVSRSALEHAAARLRRTGSADLARTAEESPAQFLTDVGLLDREGRIRRAGVLIYGTEESLRRHVPHWGVLLRTAQTPGSEGTVLLRRGEVRRPLVLLIDDILDRLSVLVRTEAVRVGAEQIDLVDYPLDALRELIANAFAHRDWEAVGTIEIVHTPDELTVSSPGGLLPTLDASRLLRETGARSPLLTREMARLRLAEQAGLGFDRVYRELARLGKPPPHVVDGPRFVVSLPGGAGDTTLARYLASGLPESVRDDVDVLLLIAHLRDHKTTSATKAAPLLQRTPPEVQRILERAESLEVVEPTRGTVRRQFPRYRLAAGPLAALRTALHYRTETIDGDDRKLIRHLRRNGQITNADVRDYLDCDIYTARNRLTRLRRKGWIDFAPDSPRRGPDVVYVKLVKLDDDNADV